MSFQDLNPYAESKIERCKKLAYESYYNASVIDKIVETRDAIESDKDFLKIYKRIDIPKKWFIREDYYPDLFFTQFGSAIAFSEKKYIVEEILRNESIQRLAFETIDLNTIRETILPFHNGIRPTVMFAPVEYFTRLHVKWRKSSNLRINTFNNITIDGQTFDIFWSNKYIPFDEFMFVDKSFGEWVSKPSFKERLSVTISESDRRNQLDLLIFTTLRFKILYSDRIKILRKAGQ